MWLAQGRNGNNINYNQETYRKSFFRDGGIDCKAGRSELAHQWDVIAA
jgi:hypothetical protein